MAELERLGRQLNELSTPASLTEVTNLLGTWLGTGPRAVTPPSGPPPPSAEGAPPIGLNDEEPEFDHTTAQIQDVSRHETPEGTVHVALLVNAAGQSLETPLDEPFGQQMFDTFQLMKRFPLLGTIYRETVMSLLDQMLAAQDAAAQTTPAPDTPAPDTVAPVAAAPDSVRQKPGTARAAPSGEQPPASQNGQ
jgi:hypothetical protein